MFDEDIKIASIGKDKPQRNEHQKVMDEYARESAKGNIEKAKKAITASIYLKDPGSAQP